MPNRKSGVKPRLTFGLHHLLAFFGGVALCSHPLPAAADVLFSDLKLPPDVYGDSGYSTGGGTEWASLFAVTGDANVTYAVSQIDLALLYESGPNSFFVWIAADLDGEPGAVIPNSRFTFAATTRACCAALDTIADIQNPILLTGQDEYFMVIAPTINADRKYAVGEWFKNDAGVEGEYVLHSDTGLGGWPSPSSTPEFTLPAFDVIGAAVPEPSSLSLLGTVVVLLSVALRRTRSTTRVSDESKPA